MMDFELLEEQFSKLSVLVIGDQCLDRTGIGKWEGYSREDEELPIFRNDRILYGPGGAGNLAANFAALGLDTTVAGIWGDDSDPHRRILEEEFKKRKINPLGMVVGSRTPTFEKFYFESGIHVIRLDGTAAKICPAIEREFCKRLQGMLLPGNYDFIAVADYDETNKGVCSYKVLEIVNNCNILSKYGTSRARASRFLNFDLLILNRKEMMEQIGNKEMTFNLKAAFLLTVTGTKNLIMTLAGQGARVFHKGDTITNFSEDNPLTSFAVPSKAVAGRIDPCGAGDTFFAVTTSSLEAGYSFESSIKLANSAARAVVRKPYGAATPIMKEIVREYTEMYDE